MTNTYMEIKEAVLLRFKVLDSSIAVSLPGIITEIGKTERSTRRTEHAFKNCFRLFHIMRGKCRKTFLTSRYIVATKILNTI